MTTDNQILNEELHALKSIFNSDELHVHGSMIKFVSNITISDDPVDVKNAENFLCSVVYLPPVFLTCTLNTNYPSTKPPQFTIECSWLTTEQLMEIALNLNLIHSQNADSPILYAWMSFIQNEIPATLHLNKCIDVSGLSVSKTELSSENFRVFNKFTGFEDLKKSLTEYNIRRKKEKFEGSILECQICLLMFKGHDSVLLDCSHAFCKTCFSSYLKNMIKDGRVIDITCPQCDLVLTPQQIHSNVDENVFGDFERLAFNHALKTMADVVYCPIVECNSPVLVEKDDNLGICPKCRFSFCTLCNRSYHGRQNPCASANLKSLAKEYLEASKEHQAFMLKKYGRSLLTLVDDVLALEEIESISKKCPRCKSAIEKNQGCNKMHCVSCNTNFCWLCLSILPNDNPYRHFDTPGSSCNMKLFDYSDSDE